MSRYYQNAADAVRVCRNGKSFKGHFADKVKAGRKEYAIAAETVKYLGVIESLIAASGLSAEKIGVQDADLYCVLIYELLFGENCKIKGGGSVKKLVMSCEEALQQELVALCKQKGVSPGDHRALLPSSLASALPRYVRLNFLRTECSREEVLSDLQSSYCADAAADPLIPSLIRLPADVKALPSLAGVAASELIIQDRASCIPSQILADEWVANVGNGALVGKTKVTGRASSKTKNHASGPDPDPDPDRCSLSLAGDIIDACSAPGNKTSHMASEIARHLRVHALTSNADAVPHIFACEKDTRRFELLSRRMAAANALDAADPGASGGPGPGPGLDRIISAHCTDFLGLDVTESRFADVQYVLLDPSCSGSGTNPRSIERNLENRSRPDAVGRLQQLQAFQIAATKKAMQFPNVHTIVYSTCSVHRIENELAVAAVLDWCRGEQQQEELTKSGSPKFGYHYTSWELKTPERFSADSWHRRGLPAEADEEPYLSAEEQQRVVRCLPDDEMIGFFVALYVNPHKRSMKCTEEQMAERRLMPPAAMSLSNGTSSSTSTPTATATVTASAGKRPRDTSPGGQSQAKQQKRKQNQQSESQATGKEASRESSLKKDKGKQVSMAPTSFLNNIWRPKGAKRKR